MDISMANTIIIYYYITIIYYYFKNIFLIKFFICIVICIDITFPSEHAPLSQTEWQNSLLHDWI